MIWYILEGVTLSVSLLVLLAFVICVAAETPARHKQWPYQ